MAGVSSAKALANVDTRYRLRPVAVSPIRGNAVTPSRLQQP
jgi:hypothetical protein